MNKNKGFNKFRQRFMAISFLIFIFFSSFACDPRYGLVESTFQLSPSSRLPKWVALPGYSRENLTVTIILYSHPFFRKAKIIVNGPPPEHKKLITNIGTERWHPFTEQQFKGQKTYDVYPNYSIIKVDNIEEVFEQKRLEPILYITDDPKLTSVLHKGK